jgi:hypothetical protein
MSKNPLKSLKTLYLFQKYMNNIIKTAQNNNNTNIRPMLAYTSVYLPFAIAPAVAFLILIPHVCPTLHNINA